MRRLENRPYRVIIPVHVAKLLAQMERATSAALQDELHLIAEQMGRTPPSWTDTRLLTLTLNGATLEYECDPENGALIAMDLVGPR